MVSSIEKIDKIFNEVMSVENKIKNHQSFQGKVRQGKCLRIDNKLFLTEKWPTKSSCENGIFQDNLTHGMILRRQN